MAGYGWHKTISGVAQIFGSTGRRLDGVRRARRVCSEVQLNRNNEHFPVTPTEISGCR